MVVGATTVLAVATGVEAPTVGRLFFAVAGAAVVGCAAEVAVAKAGTVVEAAAVVTAPGVVAAAVVPVPVVGLTAAWAVGVGFEPLLLRTRKATTPTITRARIPTPTRIKGVLERGGFAGGSGPPPPYPYWGWTWVGW